MSESLISSFKACYVCGTRYNLHKHHIYYGTAYRKKSERDGCWVYLCGYHHNLSNKGIHFDKLLDSQMKAMCEVRWLEKYGKTEENFIAEFGRSYLVNV